MRIRVTKKRLPSGRARRWPHVPPSLDLDFTTGTLDSHVTFTRSSSGTRTNASGLIVNESSNVPRFDYDPITLACRGLLIEESRTNLLTYSEQFDNAAWLAWRSNVTSNVATAPDGTNSADKLVEDTTATSAHTREQGANFTSGIAYTFSIFAKQAERTRFSLRLKAAAFGVEVGGDFNLTSATASPLNGAVVGITAIGSGWFRCHVTATAAASAPAGAYIGLLDGSGNLIYTGNGTSGLYIWGAQLEAGAFPTSYIPTTTAAVTRAADVAVMTGTNFSSWYRQDEGTFVVRSTAYVANVPSGINHGVFTATDGNASNLNDVKVFKLSGSSAYYAYIDAQGDTSQFAIQILASTAAYQTVTVALAYKNNNASVSVNGGGSSVDASLSVPSVDRLRIGDIAPAGGWFYNGTIGRLTFYPKRIPDQQNQVSSRT